MKLFSNLQSKVSVFFEKRQHATFFIHLTNEFSYMEWNNKTLEKRKTNWKNVG